jgi:DUF4097 and DUF4098 domain-containing protein YvlB
VITMISHARFPLAAVAAATILAGPGCVDIVGSDLGKYVEREEKRFSVSGQPDVDLSTFDGSIEVRPWDKSDVLVVIEKRGRDKADVATIDVHAEQAGNRVTVEIRQPKTERRFNIGWNNSRSAKLIVSVPASSNVAAKSGDGSIDIERISGRLDLRSGDGSIHARDITGDLKVHTGDGSIKLEGLNGALDADTGDGGIAASGKLTSLRARSGDGSVTIHAAPGSSASADWDIVTGDGSVVVELPDGFGAELDAHTGDGSVRLQDVTLSNVSGRLDRNTVRGTLGSGGRTLRLRTGDGSITLRRF